MKIYQDPLINAGARVMTTFFLFFVFSKNSHNELDLKPKTLNVELAQNIIIPNICVKLYKNPSTNVGARVMINGEHVYVKYVRYVRIFIQDRPYIPSPL